MIINVPDVMWGSCGPSIVWWRRATVRQKNVFLSWYLIPCLLIWRRLCSIYIVERLYLLSVFVISLSSRQQNMQSLPPGSMCSTYWHQQERHAVTPARPQVDLSLKYNITIFGDVTVKATVWTPILQIISIQNFPYLRYEQYININVFIQFTICVLYEYCW